jgi:hypothetical protein
MLRILLIFIVITGKNFSKQIIITQQKARLCSQPNAAG